MGNGASHSRPPAFPLNTGLTDMAISTQTKGFNVELLAHLEHKLKTIEEQAYKLHEALAFLDLCRASPGATETGAMRDAYQWTELEARNLAKLCI